MWGSGIGKGGVRILGKGVFGVWVWGIGMMRNFCRARHRVGRKCKKKEQPSHEDCFLSFFLSMLLRIDALLRVVTFGACDGLCCHSVRCLYGCLSPDANLFIPISRPRPFSYAPSRSFVRRLSASRELALLSEGLRSCTSCASRSPLPTFR